MLEKEVKKAVLRELEKLPNSYFYSSPVSRFGISGIADITGVVNGRAVYIECKSPEACKGPYYGMTATQRKFSTDVYAAGGIYFVVDSVELLKGWLKFWGLM